MEIWACWRVGNGGSGASCFFKVGDAAVALVGERVSGSDMESEGAIGERGEAWEVGELGGEGGTGDGSRKLRVVYKNLSLAAIMLIFKFCL